MTFEPIFPPYDPTDKSGFPFETVVKRWPVIVTGVLDQLHNVCHKLYLELQQPGAETQILQARIAEGKGIIEKISKLKYQMGRDHTLDPIPQDGEAHVDVYNSELKRLADAGKNTWFTAEWLFAECYLYRLLRSFCASTMYWNDYDPFLTQKVSTFSQSSASIHKIATSMHELEIEKDTLDDDKLRILFSEMVQMCLWGNATDLSLLTHLSLADIQHLQSVGKDAQAAQQAFILKDDQDELWKHVKSLNGGRIDFILDNAGFELFTDLVFADFLITYTPYVSSVCFHPKLIPWFVSDVTPPDFRQTMDLLSDPTFFPRSPTPSVEHLKHIVKRWKLYIDKGVFRLSIPIDTALGNKAGLANLAAFWTAPNPYWNMETHAPELFKTLKESDLVIFKGDLNYRKLTGDIQWPAWTTFRSAIGPLAGSFPLLSLRTNKADVVVGVDKNVAERLDKSGEKWRVDGRYALISFLKGSKSSTI